MDHRRRLSVQIDQNFKHLGGNGAYFSLRQGTEVAHTCLQRLAGDEILDETKVVALRLLPPEGVALAGDAGVGK